ncbi:MAG TPA: hypothetical protein VFV02_09020, partial [Acidimicrobiales bacterium]|nr:hypothetical protein [Acidimicrobiales bacterium]
YGRASHRAAQHRGDRLWRTGCSAIRWRAHVRVGRWKARDLHHTPPSRDVRRPIEWIACDEDEAGARGDAAGRDPGKARATVVLLKDDADEALETLRDLARGIYPPLLADRGLPAALESQARKSTVRITVDAEGVGRCSQDIEAAVYFCCLEALQNLQKYSQAEHAVIRLRAEDDCLRFEVVDDGVGFDVVATPKGSGITNMTDRLEALGGELRLTARMARGLRCVGRFQSSMPQSWRDDRSDSRLPAAGNTLRPTKNGHYVPRQAGTIS